MAFWSSEKLRLRAQQETLITPYDLQWVRNGAYELKLGPEAFITSTTPQKKQELKLGEPLIIPQGQFGMLLTEAIIAMPRDAIGFISVRTRFKFGGLVNVSGFHVDPGFRGRLKFSVYNAGSRPVVMQRGDPVFLIWFSDLDQPTSDVYAGPHFEHISSEDQNKLQGEIASPAQLRKDIDELRNSLKNVANRVTVSTTIAGGILVSLFVLLLSQTCRPYPMPTTQAPPIVQQTPTPVTTPTP